MTGGLLLENYQALSKTVIMNKRNRLLSHDDSLKLIGTGRSAVVFRIGSTNKAMKLFFPPFASLAKEEAEIYQRLQGIAYYPSVYEVGANYIVLDYIAGLTLFECMSDGKVITPAHLAEIDYALSLASKRGLNPSDIHLRNIFITSTGTVKIIDVARYQQKKDCRQWEHLKKAYEQFYSKRLFPKKLPAKLLNIIAFFYKKGHIPYYRP